MAQAAAKWAQRVDTIFLSFMVPDAKNPTVIFSDNSVKFEAVSSGKQYKNELTFFKTIDPEACRFQVKGRTVDCFIVKAGMDVEFWPRLTENKIKIHWLSVDFNRWKDEDDSEDDTGFQQDFDFNKLMKGQNADDVLDAEQVNMDDIDSDDDELPDLMDKKDPEATETAQKQEN